jgi:ABC-type uncharacterized transport system ATPase subunit
LSRSEELLKELISRVTVRRYEISEASLEDIFISQVGRSGRKEVSTAI